MVDGLYGLLLIVKRVIKRAYLYRETVSQYFRAKLAQSGYDNMSG